MTINARTLWTTLLAVFVAASALVTISAQAQEPPQRREGRTAGHRGMGPGRGMGPLAGLGRLNLTNEQREQVRAIVQQARTSGEAPRQTAAGLHRELRAAVFADAPDHAKIDALKASIAEARASALNARIALDLKIAEVLTPEQRAQAREVREGRGRGPGAQAGGRRGPGARR